MKEILPGILCALFLSGCAAKYTHPTSGPVATLAVPKYSSAYKLGLGFTGANILVAPSDQHGCGELAMISMDGIDKEQVDVSASSDLFVAIDRYLGNRSCNVVGVFRPDEGGQYFVEYEYKTTKCYMAVFEEDSDGLKEYVQLSKAYVSEWDGTRVCAEKSKL